MCSSFVSSTIYSINCAFTDNIYIYIYTKSKHFQIHEGNAYNFGSVYFYFKSLPGKYDLGDCIIAPLQPLRGRHHFLRIFFGAAATFRV